MSEEEKQKRKEYQKQWYKENKERVILKQKKIYDENKELINEKKKEYYQNNKEERLKDKVKEYQKENYVKGSRNQYAKEYREKNKKRLNEQQKIRNKEKRLINPMFKLKSYLRSYISTTLKEKDFNKPNKTELILGCSFEFYLNYLERNFETWMNWDNYGNPKDKKLALNKTWDIDHIKPLSSATNLDELIKLFHYTNTKPLCSYTNRNIKKNNNPT